MRGGQASAAVFLGLALLATGVGSRARADDILLSEVVGALRGTPAGRVPVCEAPALGRSRTVSRPEILAALARAGVDPKAVTVPRKVRIARRSRRLRSQALLALVREPVQSAVEPCTVSDLSVASGVTVGAGPVDVSVPRRPALRSGRLSLVLQLESAGVSVRVPVVTALRCPPPAISPGDRIQLQVVVGPVRATAPGRAYQGGRTGDMIRVQNTATGARLTGRILDGQRVEVVP